MVQIPTELRLCGPPEVTVGGSRVESLLRGEQVLAEAEGSFLHVPLEHFLQTPEGRAAGEAWRRRLAQP